MAILTKDKFRKRVIDLNGPEGNAFCLLGTAMSLCKQIGIGVERTDEIIDEMKSDDFSSSIISSVLVSLIPICLHRLIAVPNRQNALPSGPFKSITLFLNLSLVSIAIILLI